MTVGIDIDDTLTETTKTANNFLKRYEEFKDITDYHLLDKKTFNKFMLENIKEIHDLVPLKIGAREFIEYLKGKGHRVVIITARGAREYGFLVEITEKYLQKNEIIVDEIKFKQEVKGQACLELGVDIFIDDKEHILDEVKIKGIKTLRLCSKEEKSNHRIISNWEEALVLFEKGEY